MIISFYTTFNKFGALKVQETNLKTNMEWTAPEFVILTFGKKFKIINTSTMNSKIISSIRVQIFTNFLIVFFKEPRIYKKINFDKRQY